MIFATLALLMTLAAAAAVALPLWGRARAGQTADNEAAELTHRRQLAELDRDLASGALAGADYLAARHDIEAEWTSTAPPTRVQSSRNRGLALASAATLVLAAGLLYWKYGNWLAGAEGVEAASVPAVEQMVAGLSQRLHTSDQDDLQGWEMLGHSYVVMERYPEALDAYGHARRLAGDGNAEVLAGYAEAMTLANPDDFMGKALPLFEKALALDPLNAQALWYGGLGALERGDKALAVQRWQALLAQNPPEEYRQIISHYIVEAGGTPGAAAVASSAATAGPALHLHVSLASDLKTQVGPEEAVFLFAEPEGGGAGPPLAVKRFRVSDLPLDVALTDRDAMVPGRSLGGYARLAVTARISPSGAPTPQPGDLEGRGVWKKADPKPLVIVIDTPVK